MTPVGVRAAKRSVAAIKTPRVKATVVKKPNTFCRRASELYMVGECCRLLGLHPGHSTRVWFKGLDSTARYQGIGSRVPWEFVVGRQLMLGCWRCWAGESGHVLRRDDARLSCVLYDWWLEVVGSMHLLWRQGCRCGMEMDQLPSANKPI